MADGSTPMPEQPSLNPLHGLQWGWRRRLPMMLQTEAAECGLACLAMVARYHGHDVDLPGLRRRFSTSLKGVNLARVMNMATDLGFTTRPLRLELDELSQLKAPCVLHWDLNHFVVLKQAGARHIVIHDPARGERKITLKEASDHFTGVALELTPSADFKPVEARQKISLRKLTGSVRGLVPAMVQILVLALALEVFSLVGPFYMQWVLDDALVSADHSLLTLLGLGFLGIIVFQTLTSAVQSWMITSFATSLSLQWVNNLFGHMLKLPFDWYGKRHIGDITSRFHSIGVIQSTLTTDFLGALLDSLMSLVTLMVICLYSLPLTVLIVGLFLAYLILRLASFGPLYRLNEEQIVCAAKQSTEMLETIRGALPIKLCNKQAVRATRYANAMVETTNRALAAKRLGILFSSINSLLSGSGHVALIWLAALQVLKGEFTVGMLVAYVAYASQFMGRASGLVDYAMQIRMLNLHAERVSDIALSTPEKTGVSTTANSALREGTLELRHVSFRYAKGEPWVLKDCSLCIKQGELVAIVSPSGGGKTTLAKIMLGLLKPEEGEVLYGGHSIERIGLGRYRSMIGAVMQDDQLFAGSIAENISFFDPHADPLHVEAAARLAAIHTDIEAMPMGYESLVGDMGSSLSGGQKQRVILARALYRRPKLLVLDEATSHLDAEREQQVNIAIGRLKTTRIVIAHRPETVACAERTLAVKCGMVQTM